MTTLHNAILKIANWPTIALLFIAFLFCSQAFAWRQQELGPQNQVLDVRFWYAPSEVKELMDNLGVEGRELYARTQVTLDLAFPLIYGSILAILVVRLYRPQSARRLILFPLLSATADVLENLTAAYLAWSFKGAETSLAWFCAGCTAAKSLLLVGSLIVVVIGGIQGLLRGRRPT